MHLLEREVFAGAIADLARTADTGSGRVVLVAGEAGAGKTSLLREVVEGSRRQVLWGSCEPLSTARPLAPIAEMCSTAGADLVGILDERLTAVDRCDVLTRWVAAQHATVLLVVEDVHWADEATLDLLRVLSRSAGSMPLLAAVSYRDDEIDRAHPLRTFLGDVVRHPAVSRVVLPPLTRTAVEQLAAPHGVDAGQLYASSGGNPFVVAEMLAAGGDRVPASVSDAVMARVVRMSLDAQAAAELVSVLPAGLAIGLVDAFDVEGSALDECVERGLLREQGGSLVFRHEIARLAIHDAMPPVRRAAFHRAALSVLVEVEDPASAVLAHHAEAAGEAALVLHHATLAGHRAGALGAHREAAAQYRRALRFAAAAGDARRADLLERLSYECHLIGDMEAAVAARREALSCRGRLGDAAAQGVDERWLSRLLCLAGDAAGADASARRAIDLLERADPGRELAWAYSNRAQLEMIQSRREGALHWGRRALHLARVLGETEIVAHALNNIGTAELGAGRERGLFLLERSLELAREVRVPEHIVRAHVNIAAAAIDQRRFALAERHVTEAYAYCVDRQIDYKLAYTLADRAQIECDRGRWDEALALVDQVDLMSDQWMSPLPDALAVAARIRVRRGEPDAAHVLDRAARMADQDGVVTGLALLALTRAEMRWLAGDDAGARAALPDALAMMRSKRMWLTSELGCWLWRAGGQIDPGAVEHGPFRLSVRGDAEGAARAWLELGCPYDAALALTDVGTSDALGRARDLVRPLGARPLIARIDRRLRALGVRRIPRGARAVTASNPAMLTPREVEVLGFVAAGMRNSDIARRLHLSPRTVDNHVATILGKLGAATRTEAVALARERAVLV